MCKTKEGLVIFIIDDEGEHSVLATTNASRTKFFPIHSLREMVSGDGAGKEEAIGRLTEKLPRLIADAVVSRLADIWDNAEKEGTELLYSVQIPINKEIRALTDDMKNSFSILKPETIKGLSEDYLSNANLVEAAFKALTKLP